MKYLYVDFFDRLINGRGAGNNYYSVSLTAQYENLKRRIGRTAPETLREFAAYFFSESLERKYYFCLPALTDRNSWNTAESGTAAWIDNVFIHADVANAGFVPQGCDVCFVGDIRVGHPSKFVVKGIELIDSSTLKAGDFPVVCAAKCAFTGTTLPSMSKPVADFNNRNALDSVLTNEVLTSLSDKACPLKPSMRSKVLDDLSEYDKYLRFRKYYLEIQTRDSAEISSFEVCDSYMISKSQYDANRHKYEDNVLDSRSALIGQEQVILNSPAENSEEFPLIRLDIQKKKKEVEAEKDRTGKKSKYHSWLHRFSKESVAVSATVITYDKNGDPVLTNQTRTYRLGERHLICHEDLDVDCKGLEEKLKKDIEARCKDIDFTYVGIIKTQTEERLEEEKDKISRPFDEELNAYIKQLEDSLEKDIAENADESVLARLNAELRDEKAELNKELYRRLNPLRAKIEKKNKEKRKESKKSKNNTEKLAEIESEIEALTKELDEVNAEIFENEKATAESVDVREYYVERNQTLIEKKRAELRKEADTKINARRNEIHRELELKYTDEVGDKKDAARAELEEAFEKEKKRKIEDETIRCYHIYYRPADTMQSYKQIVRMFMDVAARYLIYDETAELAKLNRQSAALEDLKEGNVRNPYLAAYLFPSEQLSDDSVQTKEPEWYLPALNTSQKAAVRRAMASKGLFLLQGPPGTGKTQVIAEITAQLVKQGKKVLISSETHKAIDNVFERLPKVPEIRPLRLIPSQSEKETNYGLEKLTDNFYENISEKLNVMIKRMENFESLQTSFNEKMASLKLDYGELLKLKPEYSTVEKKKRELTAKINECNVRIEELRNESDYVNVRLGELRKTKNAINSCNFSSSDGLSSTYFNGFGDVVLDLLADCSILCEVPLTRVARLVDADLGTVEKEISSMKTSGDDARLQRRKSEIKRQMNALRDENGDSPEEGSPDYETYASLRKELMELNSQNEGKASYDEMYPVISSFLSENSLDIGIIDSLPDEIKGFKQKLQIVARKKTEEVDEECEDFENQKKEIELQIASLQLKKREHNDALTECNDSEINTKYGDLDTKIRNSVTDFFSDFDVEGEYPPGDYDKAFELIQLKSENLKREYEEKKSDYEKEIPVFRKISKYVCQDDVRGQDRPVFTSDLLNCVNVFGITCTSRDKYTENNNDGLRAFGVKEVDVRTVGIDVVIIDEVSKSFFLEMLIPVLYGKSVILVGDHRQLPPMYDLKFLRDEDFVSLDEKYIDRDRNREFTELYEKCFFKELYENRNMPESYRAMLNKQYRSHSHIMNVVNFFYRGAELKCGSEDQDDKKVHNLSVVIGGNTIIDTDHHVYFVNCEEYEQSFDESTSIYNTQEAEVAKKLLECLSSASLKLVESGQIIKSKDPKEDTRPSVGVICTYGDQARKIRKMKGGSYAGFSNKQDEKLIISTVDDFQGDERDIIIVSMVRNTSRRNVNVDFITHFERINVAFSRARKLLIILGNRKFLSERGIIKLLPDLSNDETKDKHNYAAYKEIIDYIAFDGRILSAGDILEAKDNGRKN